MLRSFFSICFQQTLKRLREKINCNLSYREKNKIPVNIILFPKCWQPLGFIFTVYCTKIQQINNCLDALHPPSTVFSTGKLGVLNNLIQLVFTQCLNGNPAATIIYDCVCFIKTESLTGWSFSVRQPVFEPRTFWFKTNCSTIEPSGNNDKVISYKYNIQSCSLIIRYVGLN